MLALLAACSFPTKHFTAGGDGGSSGGDGSGGGDARMADGPGADAAPAFACAGQPFPTTAPPSITLSGTVEAGPNQPIAGDVVDGIDAMTGGQFFNAVSDPNGVFGMTVNTSNRAIQGYLMTQNGPTSPSQYYPAHPFDATDQTIVIYCYTPSMLQQIYAAAGAPYNSNNVTFLITIIDCNGKPVAGARLQGAGGNLGVIRYVQNGVPSQNATMTDTSGEVLVLGVPPNNAFTNFNAVGPGGEMFRTYQYPSIPPSTQVTAIIQP